MAPTRLEMLITFPLLFRRWGRASWGDRRQSQSPEPLGSPSHTETHPDAWANGRCPGMFTSGSQCLVERQHSRTPENTFTGLPQGLWVCLSSRLSMSGRHFSLGLLHYLSLSFPPFLSLSPSPTPSPPHSHPLPLSLRLCLPTLGLCMLLKLMSKSR